MDAPGIRTYDLLMGKWCAHNRVDKANVLFREALSNGVPVTLRVQGRTKDFEETKACGAREEGDIA